MEGHLDGRSRGKRGWQAIMYQIPISNTDLSILTDARHRVETLTICLKTFFYVELLCVMQAVKILLLF